MHNFEIYMFQDLISSGSIMLIKAWVWYAELAITNYTFCDLTTSSILKVHASTKGNKRKRISLEGRRFYAKRIAKYSFNRNLNELFKNINDIFQIMENREMHFYPKLGVFLKTKLNKFSYYRKFSQYNWFVEDPPI